MDTIPTEILIHILSFNIHSRRQRRVRRPLARVCHFWRTVIYGHPLFWTEVRLHSTTEELQEVLSRNPDGPLDVIWAPSNIVKTIKTADMRKVEMISSQSRRWRSLVLAARLTQQMKTQLLDVPTPRLTNLNVVRSYAISILGIGHAEAGAPFREITLGRASLQWESTQITGLRCLRLHNLGDKTPTIEQFHAILTSSPALEILDLNRWRDSPPFKVLEAVVLSSLTILAVEEVSSTTLHMLLACIQAPNCKYVRLPPVGDLLLRESPPLEELARLCQSPISTVPRLILSYDQSIGTCTLTHRKTELPPSPNIRESSDKLIKRQGIYLQTGRMFVPDMTEAVLQSCQEGIRNFIQKVVHHALRNVEVEVQVDLYNRWPWFLSHPPKSAVPELLLSVPISNLRIRSSCDSMVVLPSLSAFQPVQIMDGEARQVLLWPAPLLETLTVASNPLNRGEVLDSLEGLISQRGPPVHHGGVTSSGQADERGDGASHPPRPLKHIIVQDEYELPLSAWDSTRGWRTC